MRIVLFSYNFHPDVGGIESISKMLAFYFHQQGHDVHILTKTKRATNDTFPFKVIRNPGIFRIIKELKWSDIVFENNPCFSMSFPNFIFRKPSVITLQTWLETLKGEFDTRQKLKHFFLRSASKVVACSKAIQTTFSRAIVIPNPYDESLFKRMPAIAKTKEFVFLGRLVSDKGTSLAVKAFSEVIKEFPLIKLTIIGNGEEMENLKNMVVNLQLEKNVFFTGILENELLVQSLNEHKYIIVPSIWKEPFGIVVLEAMACGCIPIVSDGGGLPEAAGKNGCVFERANSVALANCMRKQLSLPQNESENDHQQEAHLINHSITVIGKKYLELFESIIPRHV